MSRQKPILMIVEDLHWLDPSTFEMLDLWIEQLQTKHCFLVLTFRPEFIPHWRHHSFFTSLTLNRLSRKESTALVSEITGYKELPKQVLDDIIAKTDGVPLFVERADQNGHEFKFAWYCRRQICPAEPDTCLVYSRITTGFSNGQA